MKRVFITGATGFIGYHLTKELLRHGVEVFVLIREDSCDISKIETIAGLHVIRGDMEHILELPSICREREFDAFYHLAWKGASGPLRTDCAVQIDNIKWTCDAMEAAKALGCKKFIVSGTVCENQCDAIVKEKQFINSSYYLQAKKTAYELVRNQSLNQGISLAWCQFHHPIGVFNKKEQLIANTIMKLLHNEPMKFGLAQTLFDAISVEDLAMGFYLAGACELSSDKCFIGSGTPRKLSEYLEELKKIINPGGILQYGCIKEVQLPMEDNWLDISALQKDTGYVPRHSFQETVLEMKDWMENETDYDIKKWDF